MAHSIYKGFVGSGGGGYRRGESRRNVISRENRRNGSRDNRSRDESTSKNKCRSRDN